MAQSFSTPQRQPLQQFMPRTEMTMQRAVLAQSRAVQNQGQIVVRRDLAQQQSLANAAQGQAGTMPQGMNGVMPEGWLQSVFGEVGSLASGQDTGSVGTKGSAPWQEGVGTVSPFGVAGASSQAFSNALLSILGFPAHDGTPGFFLQEQHTQKCVCQLVIWVIHDAAQVTAATAATLGMTLAQLQQVLDQSLEQRRRYHLARMVAEANQVILPKLRKKAGPGANERKLGQLAAAIIRSATPQPDELHLGSVESKVAKKSLPVFCFTVIIRHSCNCTLDVATQKVAIVTNPQVGSPLDDMANGWKVDHDFSGESQRSFNFSGAGGPCGMAYSDCPTTESERVFLVRAKASAPNCIPAEAFLMFRVPPAARDLQVFAAASGG